ncbi:hypothetical protein ACFC06_25050 [Nocardia sp. NPDC056064]|uniref:hypothetical protein n=1 Tax=Nocardia sp. NPDC056064 TaxID=3345701 RepID=UPI0035DA52A4
MQLGELCRYLKKARRMYILDDRYASAVSFIAGFDVALGGEPLRRFDKFLLDRFFEGKSTSSLHWGYMIAATEFPSILVDGGPSLDRIPTQYNQILTERMIDLLLEYAAQGD